MDHYCKTILREYAAGRSILEVCSAGGMPSIVTVKKWLFNREYDYEYKGFREAFLRIQQEMLFIYYDDLRALHTDLVANFIEDKYGNEVVCPKARKHYNNFTVAIQWFKKHLELLEKLYDHHSRGLDFPIEGIHFDAILEQPKELEPREPKSCAERLMSALNNLGSLDIDTRTRVSSSLTRAEAEALLGTPLLYGRIHKKSRRKPVPRESGNNAAKRAEGALFQVSDLEVNGFGSPTPEQTSNPNAISEYPNPQTQTFTPEANSNSHHQTQTFRSLPPGLFGPNSANFKPYLEPITKYEMIKFPIGKIIYRFNSS